ncbi:MAG: hypothetical protein WAV95_04285 [Azonexus sp.]
MLLSDSTPFKDLVISTRSGKELHLLAPDAAQIEIEDIAHGLAYQCCFNGQTRHFYSIAQHSMLVAQLVPAQHRLAALLHEGAAAYLGEISRPLRHLMLEVQLIEKKIMAVFGEKFGVSELDAPSIRRAHSIALATEYRDLFFHANKNDGQSALPAPVPRRIEAITPEEAKYQFAEMLGKLVEGSGPHKHSPAATRPKAPGKPHGQPAMAQGKSCQVFSFNPRRAERRMP